MITASKVTIDPGNFAVMDDKDRRILREKKVIELIENTPSGVVLTAADFARATLKTPNNAYNLINTMLQRGQIARVEIGMKGNKPRYSYSVGDKPISSRAEIGQGRRKKAYTKRPAAVQPGQPSAPRQPDSVALAKEFYWETQSDSLHEFVEWVGKRG